MPIIDKSNSVPLPENMRMHIFGREDLLKKLATDSWKTLNFIEWHFCNNLPKSTNSALLTCTHKNIYELYKNKLAICGISVINYPIKYHMFKKGDWDIQYNDFCKYMYSLYGKYGFNINPRGTGRDIICSYKIDDLHESLIKYASDFYNTDDGGYILYEK